MSVLPIPRCEHIKRCFQCNQGLFPFYHFLQKLAMLLAILTGTKIEQT